MERNEGRCCTLCDTNTVVKRVWFVHDGNLYLSIPIEVCLNPACLERRCTDARTPHPKETSHECLLTSHRGLPKSAPIK